MKSKKQKTVLLIEDEQVMIGLLSSKFKKAGYEVKTAMDGVEGLELIRNAKPDLVLLDMMLPRMSGFELLEKLTEEKILPKLPVIIISNSGQPIEIDRAMKLGVRDYMIKVNFDPDEIVSKVNSLFGSAQKQKSSGQLSDGLPYVLIVEDDIFLIELLERKFNNSDVKAFRAMDADHAKKILSKEKIDIILLDVVMPGMDGITFLKEIKADQKLNAIPVIIISNLGQKEEIEKGYAAGAVDYIIKANATPAEIVQKVKKIINK